MYSTQLGSPSFRRRDPVLRFSNISEIKSIINRYETNDKIVAIAKTNSAIQRPASYYGQEEMIRIKATHPMEQYVEHWDRSVASDEELEQIYYNNRKSPSMSHGPLNTLLNLVLCCLKCWIGVGTASFALLCVIAAFCLPRILIDLFIYPCCRLIFGTLYPAYASYKAVRTKNVKEYVKWMMYWIVFALFTCAETFTDVFFSWFPFYYEIKIILVFWLLSPATKGSSILYRKFVHPALCRREQEIDEYITNVKEQGYHTFFNLGTKGVNYATNVIMQTAIKGGGGLVQQLRKSYSLSDLSASEDHSDGHNQQDIDNAGNVVAVSDPRLVRRTVSVRGRSPRNSSSPRVDMFFPEMDLNVGHNARAGRDVNLSHIRSSEDISTSYIPESSTEEDSLTRTSSVGGSTRTRSKVTRSTFTSIKRPGAAEDDDIIIEEIDDDQIPYFVDALPNHLVTPGGVSFMNNVIPLDQYLRFITENSPESTFDVDDEREESYKKYLELKKIFDTFETKHKNESSKEETVANVVEEPPKVIQNEKFDKEVVTEIVECDTKNVDTEPKVEISITNDLNVTMDESNKNILECSSIGSSLLSLNIDVDNGEGDFSTPNGSPNASSKYKKRRAPPPPKSTSKSSDEAEETASIKSDRRDSLIETKSVSIIDSTEGTVKHVDTSAEQSSADKEKSKSKNRSLSKLLHIPSKLAFWNKGDEATEVKNENRLDGSEFGSSIDIKSISNFQVENDKIVSNIDSNILALKKLSTSMESINDAFEDANEILSTSDTQSESVETKSEPKQQVTEVITSVPSSERQTEESQHVTHIPLKLESLVLHTESKSTDV